MGTKPLRLEYKCKVVPSKSFGATVDAAKYRQSIAKIADKAIAGCVLVGYDYNGTELALTFSNQNVLLLFISENAIGWKVLEQASLSFEKKTLPDRFELTFPRGANDVWEWKKILDGRIGKVMRKLAPSDVHLWLYMGGCEDLMFDGFHIPDENRDLLYFSISPDE